MRPLAALLTGAALPEGTPVTIARVDRSGSIEEAVAGTWPEGVAVTADDPFYGASLTKQVTGAAVAVLVREGRLDPDAPLLSFVSDLPQWAQRISIRQMLHHTSGLPGAGEISSAIVTRDWTNEVVFTALRALEDLRSEPGTKFDYSNAGYTLLAHIVGSVSGRPFADFLAEQLFGPLRSMVLASPAQISAVSARTRCSGRRSHSPKGRVGFGALLEDLPPGSMRRTRIGLGLRRWSPRPGG